MSKVDNLLNYFPELENTSLEKIIDILGSKPSRQVLYDQLCNRLLYGHTVPITPNDLVMDFAILEEVLKLYPRRFYNNNLKCIEIPDSLVSRFPDLQQLVWVFISIHGADGITTISLKSDHTNPQDLGTLIKPEKIEQDGYAKITVADKRYEVRAGSVILIPTESKHVDINFESTNIKLLNKSKLAAEVTGGDFGIAIDLRN